MDSHTILNLPFITLIKIADLHVWYNFFFYSVSPYLTICLKSSVAMVCSFIIVPGHLGGIHKGATYCPVSLCASAFL